jgi:uncharacterized RDD family membrane protein YckC
MDDYRLSTPEQVELSYNVAGLGSRFIAALVDSIIQTVALAVLLGAGVFVGLATGALTTRLLEQDRFRSGMVIIALTFLAMFIVIWGYYIFFEMAWNGQTPGKRLAGIRVITTGGQPITVTHSLVRNLVRIIDYLPSSYMLGACVMLISSRSQRLGDLAAGTIVVKERREAAPSAVASATCYEPLPPQQASAFSSEDVGLARDFLARCESLPADRRRELAEQIAVRLRGRIDSEAPDEADEVLLARVAAIRR